MYIINYFTCTYDILTILVHILTLLDDITRSTSWLYGKGVGELLVGYDFGLAKCPDWILGGGVHWRL
jgi:hypothetical protein